MSNDTKVQGYRVAVSDGRPFGFTQVFHVDAANEHDAIFRAGIQAQLLGPTASTLTVTGVRSDSQAKAEHSARGLYSAAEIERMTDDALDELLSYYGDTGNREGVRLVSEQQQQRADDREAEAEAEMAYEAEQDRQQRLHDEMVDSMYAEAFIA